MSRCPSAVAHGAAAEKDDPSALSWILRVSSEHRSRVPPSLRVPRPSVCRSHVLPSAPPRVPSLP
eukprot:4823787-Alexandrium_andersonii.AAC.3